MSTNGAAGTSKICHGSLTALINSWSLIRPAQSCSAPIKQESTLTCRRVHPSLGGFWQHVGFLIHFIIMLIPTKLSLPSLQTSPLKTDKWTELPSFFPRQIASNPNYAAFLPKCSIQTYPRGNCTQTWDVFSCFHSGQCSYLKCKLWGFPAVGKQQWRL